jgi:hypothetical protein
MADSVVVSNFVFATKDSLGENNVKRILHEGNYRESPD